MSELLQSEITQTLSSVPNFIQLVCNSYNNLHIFSENMENVLAENISM